MQVTGKIGGGIDFGIFAIFHVHLMQARAIKLHRVGSAGQHDVFLTHFIIFGSLMALNTFEMPEKPIKSSLETTASGTPCLTRLIASALFVEQTREVHN